MRIALIGVSHWHTPLFLTPLLEQDGVAVVAVSDPDAGVAQRYAAQLGCKAFTSHVSLCESERPDFVFALAPHSGMAAIAGFLIDEGIPFAMEKPVGINAEQVAALARKAEAKGHFAAIPFVFRYTGLVEALKQIAGDETVHYAGFRFIAGPPSRYIEAGCDWMLDPARSGGGSGINLSVHFLDLCQLFWPREKPSVVDAHVSNSASRTAIEDHSLIALDAGAGRRCVIETGYLYPAPVGVFDMHFSLRTDRHYFVVQGPGEIEVSDMKGGRRRIAATTTNMPHYPTFVADTLARLKAGRAPIADLWDMHAVMRQIDDAYRLSGRPAVDRR
jgi:predicted dehydrogenase